MTQATNTHILVNEFTYHEPATLAEASELLLAHDAPGHGRRDRRARAHEDGAGRGARHAGQHAADSRAWRASRPRTRACGSAH